MSKTYHETLTPGTQLLQYRIDRVLGQGGFGITYLARDANLEIKVALKEFLPWDLALRGENGQVRPKPGVEPEQWQWTKERFLLEARTLARFRHPNIVRVLNFFEANATAYIVMEYEEGESLAARLKREPAMAEVDLKGLLAPLLDGLETLHQQSFIHRDIKPENIYLRTDGSPVLLDFGSARQALGEVNKTLTAFLTPGYAPFEQYFSRSDQQGPWTDLYSLAAVLYRVVTGKAPILATDRGNAQMQNLPDPLVPAAKAGQGRYSPEFLTAIDHALRVMEKDRPRTVAAWRQQVLAQSSVTVAHEPVRADSVPWPASPRREEADLGDMVALAARAYPDRKPRSWGKLALAVVVLGGLVAGYRYQGHLMAWMRQGVVTARQVMPAMPELASQGAPVVRGPRYYVEMGPLRDSGKVRGIVKVAEGDGLETETVRGPQGEMVIIGPFAQERDADQVVGALLARFPSDAPRLLER